MHLTLQPPIPTAFAIPLFRSTAVIATARTLQRAASTGVCRNCCKARTSCCVAPAADATLVRDAATELGGRGPHIRPDLPAWATSRTYAARRACSAGSTTRWSARNSEGSLVQQVGQAAGVPIFDAVASEEHPSARLVEQFDEQIPHDTSRRFVLQAVLLHALG